MCLVSYIPLGGEEFTITSNRDESPQRAETTLVHEVIGTHMVAYPRDIKGGSWIFGSHHKDVICLLNGAKDRHKHTPPYRLSRGLMMKAYFEYRSPVDFLKRFSFQGMEPFTMIIKSPDKFLEVCWDERILAIEILDHTQPYVWSSSTLYDEAAIQQRSKYFRDHISKTNITSEDAYQLHKTGMSGDMYNGYVMNREDRVATLSISRAVIEGDRMQLIHEDLQTAGVTKLAFKVR